MDESEFDFEFDFSPEHETATAAEDEEMLWEESSHDQPPRRAPATAPPPHVVMRRRIAAAAAVALLLLIILIVVLTSGGEGGGGAYRSYVDDVSPIASSSQQAGASLGSLTAKNATSKLDSGIQQTVNDVNRLQALTPPKELTQQHAQALAALDLRLLGLQELRDSVSQSLAGTSTSTAPGVAALVASDRIWNDSVRTPANAVLQARGLGGVFPASTVVSDRKALQKSLGTLVGSSSAGGGGSGGTTQPVLSLDSKGADVVAWQNALNQWIQATGSSLTPLTADGTFGASTQAATVALQTAAGLSPDGVVGPSTRQALQEQVQAAKSGSGSGSGSGSTAATLKVGDTGQDVVEWQQQLNRWLQATSPTQTQLTTDGSFGQSTQNVTEQLQSAAGLTPTGEVDARTRQALATALSNATPSRG
jgi:peptidoglycan hydrolase-like protein with peptidoglycan-binding domain